MALTHAPEFAPTSQRLHRKAPWRRDWSGGRAHACNFLKKHGEHSSRASHMTTAYRRQGTSMDIDHLIQELASHAKPVTRLPAPWRRAARWIAASLVYVGVVVA